MNVTFFINTLSDEASAISLIASLNLFFLGLWLWYHMYEKMGVTTPYVVYYLFSSFLYL